MFACVTLWVQLVMTTLRFLFDLQVKNPKRDLPLGVGISLSLSCILYMLLSFVIVGLVPYYDLNKDTPISSAFSDYNLKWAV